MKGLQFNCCVCQIKFESKNRDECYPILLLCDCLISLCNLCAMKQLLDRPCTYRSYVECPICKNKDCTVSNRFIKFDDCFFEEKRLIGVACMDCIGRQQPLPTIPDPKNLKTIKTQYDNVLRGLASLGYDVSLPIESSDLAIKRLFVARIASHYETNSPIRIGDNISSSNGVFHIVDPDSLPLGPILKLQFKKNATLLHLISAMSTTSDIGDLVEEFSVCTICDEPILRGSSVLGCCGCKPKCCQRCARYTVINYDKTYRQEHGIRCPTCNKEYNTAIYNKNKAAEMENKLLAEVLLDANIVGGSIKDDQTLYQLFKFFENNKVNCNLTMEDFFGSDDQACLTTEKISLKLSIAQLRRTMMARTNDPSIKQQLQYWQILGPLAMLKVHNDRVWEVMFEHYRCDNGKPINTEFSDFLESSKDNHTLDEATGLVIGSENVAGGDVDDIADKYSCKIVRKRTTRCPHCTVDPQCEIYRQQHITNFHEELSMKSDGVYETNSKVSATVLTSSSSAVSDIPERSRISRFSPLSKNDLHADISSDVSASNEYIPSCVAIPSEDPMQAIQRGLDMVFLEREQQAEQAARDEEMDHESRLEQLWMHGSEKEACKDNAPPKIEYGLVFDAGPLNRTERRNRNGLRVSNPVYFKLRYPKGVIIPGDESRVNSLWPAGVANPLPAIGDPTVIMERTLIMEPHQKTLLTVPMTLDLNRYGFNGIIKAWRSFSGAELANYRAFSEYSIKNGSTISIVPLDKLKAELKRPEQPWLEARKAKQERERKLNLARDAVHFSKPPPKRLSTSIYDALEDNDDESDSDSDDGISGKKRGKPKKKKKT